VPSFFTVLWTLLPVNDECWAKSAPEGADGETLVEHTQRVLRNLVALHKRHHDLSRICRTPRLWHRVTLALAMHDIGKCVNGFQAMLRANTRFPHRHEVISAGFAHLVIVTDDYDDLPWVVAGILAHHRDARVLAELYPGPNVMLDLEDGLSSLSGEVDASYMQRALRILEQELIPAAQNTGLTATDWGPGLRAESLNPDGFIAAMRDALDRYAWLVAEIRRSPANGPSALAGRFTRGLVMMADHAGSAHKQLLSSRELDAPDAMLNTLTTQNKNFRLSDQQGEYAHQTQAACAVGNVLLTAPTGSGKTESALLWAARNGVDHTPGVVFYILPYQASLNAMRRRLGRLLGERKVVLQHSRAVHALYRLLLDNDSLPSKEASERAKKRAREEAQVGRLHLTPLRILTPYQLLKAAFQLPGHEALWTDCTLGRYILDEIHAYEPERLGMILGMFRHLVHDLGSHVFVMSATVPTVLRELLYEALGSVTEIWASHRALAAFRRHRLLLQDGDLLAEKTFRDVLRRFHSGQNVLIIATTVGRAQRAYDRLKQKVGSSVTLLHGKFCARDRFSKEQALLERVEVDSDAPSILVATQVVEVSLDIDFDVLFSDPAPIEALLQRFGRVNRRRRHKLADVVVLTGIPEGAPVYDHTLVVSALRELARFDNAPIDEGGVQKAIDGVYAGQLRAEWDVRVREAEKRFNRDVLSSLYPFESDAGIEDLFARMFDGREVLPAGLYDEFQELSNDNPFEASELMVPLSDGQFQWLKRNRRLRQMPDGLWVVDALYDSETGLQLNGRLQNQDI